MKKIVGLLLIISLGGCVKVEDEVVAPKKLDLNGTFVGKVTGFAGNAMPINGTATWVIVHQGNDFTANITYENVNSSIVPSKYQGAFSNDSTIVGGFLNTIKKSIVTGKVSKNGNQITCSTDATDPDYNYVRLSFDLTRK